MNNNETIAVLTLIGATVTVVALLKFRKQVDWTLITKWFHWKLSAKNNSKWPEKRPTSPKDPSPEKQATWLARRWRAVLIVSVLLFVIVTPIWWWFEQPAPWRMLLSDQFKEVLKLLRQGPNEPYNIPGHATLERVTNMVKICAQKLNNSYHNEDLWIVDHYWQYWNTPNLDHYLTVNKVFVAQGGKIHRMFFLTQEELQNPDVQTMLKAQCAIGKLGADQTGNGFELWRADPRIMKNQEEYETISRQFRQLPNTDKNFENFDVMQFNDTLYYSSDFSTDYRVMGSSTWIFNPEQVSKIDLRPLFKKSIAERIACDRPAQETVQRPVRKTAVLLLENRVK